MGHQGNHGRAKRRTHKLRMKARAVRIYSSLDPQSAERLADHLAHCSCFCCGNPRRHYGDRTIGELRQLLREHDRE